jgi:hypothetical protein
MWNSSLTKNQDGIRGSQAAKLICWKVEEKSNNCATWLSSFSVAQGVSKIQKRSECEFETHCACGDQDELMI